LWLKLVLRAERAVGTRVESAVHSDAYFDLVAELSRTKTRVTGRIEGASKRILHLANLPAGTDIRRVREQLARMERRIVELSKELDQQRAEREELDQQRAEREALR
jgi:TolA-binding protein